MNQEEVLLSIIKTLNRLDLPYFLTGAYAVSIHGAPRATHDIDLQIHLSAQNIDVVYDSFKEEFYVSKEGIRDALKHKTMFNLVHQESQTKIDFWIPRDNEYDRERFRRRREITIQGVKAFVLSPEDTILTKLDWHKKSKLEKHLGDALGILKVQSRKLDLNYIETWAAELSVKTTWTELKKTAGEYL
jgi:hypothetical protein